MFRDDFTDFSYNNISSREMKVWITNSHDLTEIITPKVSDSYISPSFADGRYYSGSTISSSSISLKCIAIDISDREKHDIAQWLNPRSTGRLTFGYDPYHYYEVKVSDEILGTKWVRGRYDKNLGGYTYIYEFTVKFETINDWAKLGNPVNLRLDYIKQSLEDVCGVEEDDETEEVKQERQAKQYEYLNNQFSNCNNSYFLPNILYAKLPLISRGVYTASEFYNLTQQPSQVILRPLGTSYNFTLDTTEVSIKNPDGSSNNFDQYASITDKNTMIYLYYDCVLYQSNWSTDANMYTITNLGTENLTFTYSNLGTTKKDETDGSSSYQLGISCDQEEAVQAEYIIGSETFLSIVYDSSNGILTNGGQLFDNVTKSNLGLPMSGYQSAINPITITTGNAEIVELNNFITIESVTQNNETWYKTITLTDFYPKYDHYGLCHFSLFDTKPTSEQTYSCHRGSKSISYTNNVISFDGYCIPSTTTLGKCVLIVASDVPLPSDTKSGNTEKYNYISISNAHYLLLKSTGLTAMSDEMSTEYISLQTREA